MDRDDYPPGVTPASAIVMFDGVCVLCNACAQYLIKYDTESVFTLASMQSPEGQAILQWFGLKTDDFDTLLLVEGRSYYERSEAFIRIFARLPFPWKLLRFLRFVPAAIRNWAYNRIALNRYALFGKFDSCVLPDANNRSRFLVGGNHTQKQRLGDKQT